MACNCISTRSLRTLAIGPRQWGGKHTGGKSAPGFSTDKSSNITPAPTAGAGRRRRLVRVERRALLGSLDQLKAALRASGQTGTIQTAFVERLNLTVRQAITALTRRTWGVAQSPAELLLHLEWWRAYYHFTRPHTSLDKPFAEPRVRGGRRLPQHRRPRTPAQAVGVTDHRWTILELLSCPLPRVGG